jgi:selenocysteine lyase/cysteine desulfurase
VTQCSDSIGTFKSIKLIADIVQASNTGAEIVVDGVVYAPHRIPDVRDLNIDLI